jgi:hypothetical protein
VIANARTSSIVTTVVGNQDTSRPRFATGGTPLAGAILATVMIDAKVGVTGIEPVTSRV